MPTTPTPSPAHDHADTGRLAAAVRVVSGLTLVSRFAGLARDIVTARVFGDDALGSAFRAAYAVPNLFRRLFGEGALSAAFVPEYVILTRDDPDTAGQLARLMVRFVTLATGALTLLIAVVLAALLWLLPPEADRALSFRLMLLMLPMMPAVCLTAILGGMLQAHQRFGPPAAAPIVLNVFQIAAGALYFIGMVTDRVAMAYWVGGAALAASAAQVAWSLWALRGRVRWGKAGEAARARSKAVLGRFVPAMLGLGTLQLNTTLDMVIAMWPIWVGPTVLGRAVPLDDKSNAVLSYTQTIYQFPLGVFGLAVATAVFPLLSRTADRPVAFVANLRRGLRLSFFIGLPATLGLILVRDDLVAVIFGGGTRHAFTGEGLARSASVLLGFAPGVWAYSLNHVYTRAFYARGDTRTPMRVAMAMVGLNLTLNLTLVWVLREAGLAWATSISATVQCLVLGWLCRTRLGVETFDPETKTAFARMTLCGLAMASLVWTLGRAMPIAGTWTGHLVNLTAAVVVGGGVFLVLARMFRMPELGWLVRRSPGDDETPTAGE
ncbi:MAG: putative lipid II flippase MurJ [Phycisphaerae bacterium]|nr:MAG: putative lipid II flippase MurJ [Phycisphaerae bacterium]